MDITPFKKLMDSVLTVDEICQQIKNDNLLIICDEQKQIVIGENITPRQLKDIIAVVKSKVYLLDKITERQDFIMGKLKTYPPAENVVYEVWFDSGANAKALWLDRKWLTYQPLLDCWMEPIVSYVVAWKPIPIKDTDNGKQ